MVHGQKDGTPVTHREDTVEQATIVAQTWTQQGYTDVTVTEITIVATVWRGTDSQIG
jgi:hypothetical protein